MPISRDFSLAKTGATARNPRQPVLVIPSVRGCVCGRDLRERVPIVVVSVGGAGSRGQLLRRIDAVWRHAQ